VVARAAIALAAWNGRDEVTAADVADAARLALPHRRRRDPFDDPGLDPDRLDEALSQTEEVPEDPEPDPEPPGGGSDDPAESSAPQTDSSGNGQQKDGGQPSGNGAPPTRSSAPPSATFRTKALVVPGVGEGAPGRRSRARNRTGSTVGSTEVAGEGHGTHVFATLLAAVNNQRRPGRPQVQPDDVRRAVREGREGNLVIFVVDASGSMAARDRMSAVGGATLSLLRDAYQRRDKVAVITFRGQRADVLLPPTSSVYIAGRRLARFDTGGRTPLAEGLLAARELIIRERVRDKARRPLVVVLTDGRATAGPDPLGRSRIAAARLVAEGAAAVVVDCETSYVRLELAGLLARQLGAPAVRLEHLHADYLTRAVRSVA